MDNLTNHRSQMRSIIVIKPRAIGDVLLSTSVLPNLREAYPDARIDFLVESFASEVLLSNPNIDHVITYDTRKESSLSIILKVRKNKYEMAVDLFGNPRTAVITLLSGARVRVGFPFKWRRYAYNILVPPRSGSVHNVEFNLDALRRLGIPVNSRLPQFFLDQKHLDFAGRFLISHGLKEGRFVSINIGGGWNIKRWPVDKFVELSKMIKSELHEPVAVLYGPSEVEDARRICESSGAVLAPPTSLKEMGAILKLSHLLVTNDSGPMHIAAALGVPTLAIFGPTSPRLQGPYGNISEIVRNEKLDCLECNLTRCPIGNLCMTQLDPENVFSRLQALLVKIESGATASTSSKGVS